MAITFERLVSRNLVLFISNELDLAGVKMNINSFIKIGIFGSFGLLIAVSFGTFILLGENFALSALAGILAAILYGAALYAVLEYRIDRRRTFIDEILPDYLQLTSANIRSGVALDKALIEAARPEFLYFKDDVLLMGKQLYSGETMQNTLFNLSNKYRSLQLKRTVRMMSEALRYGGGMSDILNQLAKDLRNQLTIKREISGQLFMYSIFIIFASVIGAPVLYGLTNRMISITDTIWGGILQQSPGGLNAFTQSSAISFLKPHAPTIQPSQYYLFSIVAIIIISGMSSMIVAAISFGSMVKGLRNIPLFIVIGLVVFFVTSFVIGSLFSTITAGA